MVLRLADFRPPTPLLIRACDCAATEIPEMIYHFLCRHVHADGDVPWAKDRAFSVDNSSDVADVERIREPGERPSRPRQGLAAEKFRGPHNRHKPQPLGPVVYRWPGSTYFPRDFLRPDFPIHGTQGIVFVARPVSSPRHRRGSTEPQPVCPGIDWADCPAENMADGLKRRLSIPGT